MKNKNGWGLGMELAYICLFVICLIIAIKFLSRLGLADKEEALDPGILNIEMDSDDIKIYNSYINKLEKGAKKYVSDYLNGNVSDGMKITGETLIKNDCLELDTNEVNNSCNGYVIIDVGLIVKYEAYASCDVYTTTGYE